MSIDIEEVRSVVREVIAEYGQFHRETGEFENVQSEAIHAAMRLEQKLLLDTIPVASNWNGEGLPPVGTVCLYSGTGAQSFLKCEIMGRNGELVWLKTPIDNRHVVLIESRLAFYKIETPEQIQRDELTKILTTTLGNQLSSAVEMVTDALIAAGYHK